MSDAHEPMFFQVADNSRPLPPKDRNSMEAAVIRKADEHGVHHLETTDDYFVFDHPLPGYNIAKVSPLMKSVLNKDTVLSPEEEQMVAAYQRGIFKLHLQVPENRKMEVFEALLAGFQKTRSEGDFDTHRIMQWKMRKEDDLTGLSSAFVFYPHRLIGEHWEDIYERNYAAVKKAGVWLYNATKSLDLPPMKSPRHSGEIAVLLDKPFVSHTLFLCQGDGDWKDYLFRQGGVTRLSQEYDPTRNFAVRQGTSLILS